MTDETASDRLAAHFNPSVDEGLEPCPFCQRADNISVDQPGESGPEQRLWHVQCIANDCANPIVEGETEADAVALWNTRTALTRPLGEGEELASALLRYIEPYDLSPGCGSLTIDRATFRKLLEGFIARSTLPQGGETSDDFAEIERLIWRGDDAIREGTKLREALEMILREDDQSGAWCRGVARTALSTPSSLPIAPALWRCVNCKAEYPGRADEACPERCPRCRCSQFAEIAQPCPSIAPDHVLVPREPTPEMLAAGGFKALPRELRDSTGAVCPGTEGAAAIWSAMLSAAPQPPSPGHGDDAIQQSEAYADRNLTALKEALALRGAPPPSGEAEAVARVIAEIAEHPTTDETPGIAEDYMFDDVVFAARAYLRTLSPNTDGADHG